MSGKGRHVPTALLARWERDLEDVSLWRFLPTPVHGSFTGPNILASFDDEEDAATGRVSALLGWEEAHIGDPAEDLAELAALAPPEVLRAVVDAYGPSRIDRPDSHLLARARLSSEMRLIRRLLRAVAAEERELVDRAAQELRDLDDRVFTEAQRKSSAAENRPSRRLLSEDAVATAPEEPPLQPQQEPAASGIETVAMPLAASDAAASREDVVTQAVAYAVDEDSDGTSVAGLLPASGQEQGTEPEVEQPAEPEVKQHAEPGSPADPEAGHPGDAARSGVSLEVSPEGTEDTEDTDSARRSALHFEIEEAEPLDDGGVFDLHEGASEFVPVERRPPPSDSPESG
jgi:hypothetical protein